jgi:hypothetical protein
MRGWRTNNKLARVKIHLLFLVGKSYKAGGNLIAIPENFEALNTSM